MKAQISQEELKRVLHYEPETGDWTWLVRLSIRIMVGRRAGALNAVGYIALGIYGRDYLAHRLAWFYMTGEWPPNDIDHKNGIRHDNRWCNLRPATRQQNLRNMRRRNGAAGYKGVVWHGTTQKWVAQIKTGSRMKYLGVFADPKDAHEAYCEAARELFGEFARFE